MANLSKFCYSGHRLYLEDNGKIYKCDGCKTCGKGLTYRCDTCDYDLHEECMHSKATISPEIFEGDSYYEFNFFKSPPRRGNSKSLKGKGHCAESRNCVACGMPVEGFVYYCEETNMDLHPTCALLPKRLPALDDDLDINLVLTEGVMLNSNFCCNLCQTSTAESKIPGWCYVSDYGGEEFGFHVHCIQQLWIMKTASHPA